MTAAVVIQYVLLALQTLPTVTADVASIISDLKAMQASGTDPTPAQWDVLHTRILARLDQLSVAG